MGVEWGDTRGTLSIFWSCSEITGDKTDSSQKGWKLRDTVNQEGSKRSHSLPSQTSKNWDPASLWSPKQVLVHQQCRWLIALGLGMVTATVFGEWLVGWSTFLPICCLAPALSELMGEIDEMYKWLPVFLMWQEGIWEGLRGYSCMHLDGKESQCEIYSPKTKSARSNLSNQGRTTTVIASFIWHVWGKEDSSEMDFRAGTVSQSVLSRSVMSNTLRPHGV